MSRKLWVFAGALVAITLFYNIAGAEPQEWPGQPELLPLDDSTVTPEISEDITWISMDQEFQPSYYPSYESCNDHRCGFYAGVEIAIVKPYWEDEVDTMRVRRTEDGRPDVEFGNQIDPDYDCSVSPRLYLGYRNCNGLGARVRYWVFDEPANPLAFESGDAMVFRSADLNVQALDLEATKLLYSGPFQLELSGGARYGRVRADAGNDRQLNVEESTVAIGRAAFEGVGPTISAEARHQLGCSRFAVVGNIRGSLLFGQSNFYYNQIETSLGPDKETTALNDGSDDIVPVLESQFGLEWAKCFTVRRRLALRAMMEGQWWGVSTPGASFPVIIETPPTAVSDIYTTGRDLGFFGVTAAIIYEH